MRLLSLFAIVVPVALAGCVAPPARVAPAPAAPRPVPPPVAAPAPLPLASDWRDWPVTPGDWRYASDGSARFGTGTAAYLTLRCAGEAILLTRDGPGGAATVRTTTLTRAVPLGPDGVARLAASDPLFDAIGFSRGRFVVETAGAPPLVVPAWAEVLRVVEDCRR